MEAAPVAVAVSLVFVVIAAVGVLAAGAFGTASARISGSTDNDSSVFEAGRIELRLGDDESLLFDVDGVYPGLVLDRCIDLVYVGSLDDVDIRLSARLSGGDGLERFVETSIILGEGIDPECDDFAASETIFDGRLGDVWASHPDFTNGLTVADAVEPGFASTVRISAEIVDDNAAQGLTTDFWMTLEARP